MAGQAQKSGNNNKQTPAAPTDATTNGETHTVNRKKQKRREKQAAKLAAQGGGPENGTTTSSQTVNTKVPGSTPQASQANGNTNHAASGPAPDPEDLFYTEDELEFEQIMARDKAKRKKNKKPVGNNTAGSPYENPLVQRAIQRAPPPNPPPAPSSSLIKHTRDVQKNSIWNTSTAEERERIKDFWVGLPDTQRRSLVKVEKEAVLRKMKEQQKQSCSCSVCGRKRSAIEEELEVLYDAYYVELEDYANDRGIGLDGQPYLPPGNFYPPASMRQNLKNGQTLPPATSQIANAYEEDDLDDEYDSNEEEDEEDDDEDYEDDSYASEIARQELARSQIDFLGQNLKAQGGILTVADDLLKNEGRRFIDMMESLAERRMQREEEAQYNVRNLQHPMSTNHDPGMDDDEYDDEEDDEDYASDEEDEYDDEEMETMTADQRMQEGRRMFQIFAARMFEQRVLNAYREKVALERQEKLLEELDDDKRLDEQREAKRARDAAKKKEKKNKQKAAKKEEESKKEAEKAAQEAAEREAEEARLEEQRARKEAQRKKKEAEKQAQDAERHRKEAEKLKKQQEAKEQQLELERKQREAKEKEKKRKEELKKKEKEEREAKEKEKREREAAAQAEQQAKDAREREAREKAKKEEASKPLAQPTPVPIPLARKPSSTIPPGFGTTNVPSPHLQIATPAIPKAPTPIRARQPSRQGSIQSSPKSTTQPASSSATSPSTTNVAQPVLPPVAKNPPPQALPVHAPVQHTMPIGPPPGLAHQNPGFMSGSPAIGSPAFAPGFQAPPPGLARGLHHDMPPYQHQPFSPHQRFVNGPSTIGHPPGITPQRLQRTIERPSPVDLPSAVPTPIGIGITTGPAKISHSRNTSGSFESPGPIQPIGRPNATRTSMSSVRPEIPKQDMNGVGKQLGSSALLDDTDSTFEPTTHHGNVHRPPRLGGFNAAPGFPHAINSAKGDAFSRSSGWGAPSNTGFGTPNISSHGWPSSGPGWSNNAFSSVGTPGRQPRPVILRQLVVTACRNLSQGTNTAQPIGEVMNHIEQFKPPGEPSFQLSEVLDICETEGNSQNGGGTLYWNRERGRGDCVRWSPDTAISRMAIGVPGDIGSPIVGTAHSSFTSRGS